MQKRSMLNLEDPLPLSEIYRQRHIKLAPKLITDWQRVAVALDLLIRAGEIIPGKFSSCTAITALLMHRTTTFDETFEVYRRSISRDVLDAVAPADSRARRRHNAIIDNLATARLKGRYVLPAPAAQARDTAAREELWRLAARLPDGLPDGLPALPVSLRQRVEEIEINPEMVEAVSARLRAAAKKMNIDGTPTRDVDPVEPEARVENLEDTGDEDPVEPDAGVEKLGDMGDEGLVEPGAHVEKLEDMGDEGLVEPGAHVEKLEDTGDEGLVEPGAHVEKLEDTGDEDLVEPGAHVEKLEDTGDEDLVEPGAHVENPDDTREVVRTTEEKLADILAAGRTPDPDRELYEYLLWLAQRVNTTAAPPASKRGFLRRLLG